MGFKIGNALSGAFSGAATGSVAGPWGALAGGVAGGLLGGFSGGDESDGMGVLKDAVAMFGAIGIPETEAMEIMLETPEIVGELVPILEKEYPELASKFEEIAISAPVIANQAKALDMLSDRADMGLTPEDEAELNMIRREALGSGEAANQRVLQNMAERGILGSGQELAMRQAANQQASQNMAEMGDRQAAMSFQNRMNAINSLANQASSQRKQEFGEQADVARARDLFNQYNRNAAMNTQQRNVNRQNEAMASNLSTKQAQENLRAQLANQQEIYNKELIQREFDNRLRRAAGATGQMQNVANAEMNRAANRSASQGQMIGGAATIAGSLLGGMKSSGSAAAISDKNLKVNVNDGDDAVENMMDNLSPYEYDYKPEVGEEGRKLSVMAQDLEKSPIGEELVEDMEMGKMVDYGKAAPVMMASDANLHRRMKRLEKMLLGDNDES